MDNTGSESFPTFDPTFTANAQPFGEHCPSESTNVALVGQATKVARGRGRVMTGAPAFHGQSVTQVPSYQRERAPTTVQSPQDSVANPESFHRGSFGTVGISVSLPTVSTLASSRRRSSAIISSPIGPSPISTSGTWGRGARRRNDSATTPNVLDDPYGTADPFFGASEPLLDPVSPHPSAVSYSNQWTPAEDSALLSFRNHFRHHEWNALRKAWQVSYPLFPAHELSDMMARWRFLSSSRSLQKSDKRHIWVLRNSTVPETWHDICTLLHHQGKSVDLTTVIEAEREWGYYLNINNAGFRWPQPEPRGTLFPDDGEAIEQFELTMRDQLVREYDLVLAMYHEGDCDVTDIAEHFLEKGIRWEEDEVVAVLDEYGRYDRSARTRLIFGKVIGPVASARSCR